MAFSSSWKHNLLACHHFSYIQIEEVTVEDGLNNTSNDGNDIIELFEIVSVDPVENIKSSVCSQGKKIV